MRKIFLAVLIVAITVAGAFLVRVQPRGSATVFRTGAEVAVRGGVIFLRPAGAASACRVATAGDHLEFQAPLHAFTRTRDELELATRILYDPPSTLPRDWPSGDWCSSLARRVAEHANAWASGVTADQLMSDRRASSHSAADAIRRALERDGARVSDARASIALPAGIERVRTTALVPLAHPSPPVIFIGLDGADWELLDDFMRDGSMPTLARLVREGSGGVLETEHPPLSPLIWTTMFTGVSPLDHRILDFTRFNPYTHEREPITSDERQVPAIWNMATAAGKSTAVFGVWATYAAEPVHGLNVSDRLFTFLFSESSVPADAVYPALRTPWARAQLDAAERAVPAGRVREYLPWISDADYALAAGAANPYAQPASALRRILVETEVYRRLASDYLAEGDLPDLSILYLQGTDTIGHVFAPFAPPRQAAIAQADYDRYSGVPARYFHEIDDLLASFVALAERKHAVIMIASDHGFRWKEGRPTELSSFAAASAAKWHRNEGIFVLWGPGIAASPGHPLRGGVRQTCATLAALTGMPPALGTETTALVGAPPTLPAADYKPFFQRAAPPSVSTNSKAAAEDVAKLRALGYLGSNEPSKPLVPLASDDTMNSMTAGAYNNAGLIQRQQRRVPEAVRSFERALAVDPGYASAAWNLSETLFDGRQQLDRSDGLLVQAAKNGLPEGSRFVIGRAIAYQRSGRLERAVSLLDSAIASGSAGASMYIFRGRYRMDRNDCRAALDDFRIAARLEPNAIAFASIGLAEMCLGDATAARESFQRSLQIDPNQPMLQRFVGR